MYIHTVQYSVQPSKGEYTIRVYYARKVDNPQNRYTIHIQYTCIAYIYYIHAYPSLPPTPPHPHPPRKGNKIRYKLSVLQYYIIFQINLSNQFSNLILQFNSLILFSNFILQFSSQILKPSKYIIFKFRHLNIYFGQIEYAESEFDNENFSKILQNFQNMQIKLKYLYSNY